MEENIKEKQIKSNIINYLNNNLTENEQLNCLYNIHNLNSVKLIEKDLTIKILDLYKMWGWFKFNGKKNENQTIELNNFKNYPNVKYKRALQLINFFHETTHEKQRDYFIYNNKNKIEEKSEYNKILNLEIFCQTEAELLNYEQLLVEIDAIYNSIKSYNKYLNENAILKSQESYSVLLYACVRYFASLNLEKHHKYFPNSYEITSNKLIKYYKDFYKTLEIEDGYFYISLNEALERSENLNDIKKQELLNINFENAEKEINTKTKEVFNIMEEIYFNILKTYNPSKQVYEYFKFNSKNDWLNYVKNNNMIKISAIICDDLHDLYSNSKNLTYIKENVL